jgi:hypothetical protein
MSLHIAGADGPLQRCSGETNTVRPLQRFEVLRDDYYGRSRRGSFHSHSSL